ncbi:putative lipase 1 [[Candida] railenensis]|uniref:Lipase 1 n=1 Tax=[Candida] railenensis TaxID=45579 RepID=A0A9P0QQN6_9ASCO|nr:putative lipase 1 [[Candida] railenensis]
MKLFTLVFYSFLIRCVFAAPMINPRASLTLPADDPFYSPPSGYENEELGAILRVRQLDPSTVGLIDFSVNVKEIYQLLVHSQDTHNQSNAIVTTVFVPYNADPDKLVSYHMAEDTASINCAPSYAMQLDSDILSWITPQVELLLVVPPLQEGYIVIVPDHEGPKSTYAAGYQAGHAILNSIRATINLGTEIGISQNPDVALWGYSGGAFSTSWAASLAPTYAPELNIIGAAMGGVPVSLQHLAIHCMGNLFSGFMFAAILALSHEYPELAEELPKLIIPEKLDYLYTAQDHCLVETIAFFAYATWDQYCIDGVGILDNPVVKSVLDQNNLLTSGLLPNCPFIIYSSTHDEVVPIEDTNELVEYWCSQGINVELRRDVFSGHVITAIDGTGLAFNFIKDRFNNVELNPTCQNSTISFDLLNEGSLAGFGDIAVDDIEWLFGGDIGPSSPSLNSSSSSPGSPAGKSGIIDAAVNYISQIIASVTTPDDPDNVTTNQIYDLLASYITTIANSVSSVTDFISNIFGFGSSDSALSNNSTGSSAGSIVSSLLSTAGSLISGPSSNSTTDGSSSSSGGSLISSLVSTGQSLASDLFSNSTTDSSSSGGGGLLSSLLSTGTGIVSSLLSGST